MDIVLLTQLILFSVIILEVILRILAVFILSVEQVNFKKNLSSSFFFRVMLFSLIAFNIEKIALKISEFVSAELVDKAIVIPLWLLPSIVYGIYAVIDHQLERRNHLPETRL